MPDDLPTDHIVVHGDTLSQLAQHYYGDGSEQGWRRIYDANKEAIGDNPHAIKPGTKLTIPAKAAAGKK